MSHFYASAEEIERTQKNRILAEKRVRYLDRSKFYDFLDQKQESSKSEEELLKILYNEIHIIGYDVEHLMEVSKKKIQHMQEELDKISKRLEELEKKEKRHENG